MTDDKVNPDLAVDIDPARIRAAAEEGQAKIAAAKAEQEAQEFFERWERAGQRAFKGIYSRPLRRQMLKSALRKMERETEDA